MCVTGFSLPRCLGLQMWKLRQDKGWQLGCGSILGTQELLTLEGLLGLLNLAPAPDTFHLPPFSALGFCLLLWAT